MDFVEAFVPERGDLLYGLRDTRTDYVKRWEAQTQQKDIDRLVAFLSMTEGGGKANWSIIDEFNNHFFLGGAVDFSPDGNKGKGLAQLYARMAAVEKTLAKGSAGQRADQVEQRAAYLQEIQQSRFSPLSVFDASKAKTDSEGFRPASGMLGKKKKEGTALEQNRGYLAIRRACKFGLGLAATNSAFLGAQVHFLLDGLDLSEVATKGTRVGYGGRTSVSITTSEVRYLHRNWGRLNKAILFYVNLQPVDPPWVTDWSLPPLGGLKPNPMRAHKALWDQYGRDRDVKYAGQLPNKPLY